MATGSFEWVATGVAVGAAMVVAVGGTDVAVAAFVCVGELVGTGVSVAVFACVGVLIGTAVLVGVMRLVG
jgi:hypothetical protein